MKTKYAATLAIALLIEVGSAGPVGAQSFSSGSNGSDGALNLTTPGTIVFDPKTFNPPLDPAGDNVFNFTTINIAAGVTVKLVGNVLNGPVTWLAQGNVTIDGTIDLSGQDGFTVSSSVQRAPATPGAGGFGGGIGGFGSNPETAGFGPTGGATSGCIPYAGAIGGGATGNQFLVPLVGGSGGGGDGARGGGAGGGALLIASSTSIALTGSIVARGGMGNGPAADGAGGGLRLVSNTISLTSSSALDVSGGHGGYCGGSKGTIRIEAFQLGSLGTITGNVTTASPFGVFLNSSTPAIRVVSVGGVPVATYPTGAFTMPDVTVNSTAPLPVSIQAQGVPLGTVVTLLVFSENGPDQTIQSTGLAGTVASSTATAQVTLPPGFSRGLIQATWTQ